MIVFKKKATARPSKADVRACAQTIAREFRRRADDLDAAITNGDPLAAAVDGLSMGRVWSLRIPAKPIGHSGRCRSLVPARRSPGA